MQILPWHRGAFACLLALATVVSAGEKTSPYPAMDLDTGEGKPPLPAHFAYSPYAAQPHQGEPYDAGVGYPHYDCPTPHYGPWFRPRAFGLGVAERCAPRPFRPRGFGNLFNRPSTCHRMDYTPYAVTGPPSLYGPAYYARQPDQRCKDCEHDHEVGGLYYGNERQHARDRHARRYYDSGCYGGSCR